MILFLYSGLVTWPVFGETVQIWIKPPNALMLSPGMVRCWEVMAGRMLSVQSGLSTPTAPPLYPK